MNCTKLSHIRNCKALFKHLKLQYKRSVTPDCDFKRIMSTKSARKTDITVNVTFRLVRKLNQQVTGDNSKCKSYPLACATQTNPHNKK